MPTVCFLCEREVESLRGHRCEAEIGIVLSAAAPQPIVERVDEIVSRLASIAPAVKSWFVSPEARDSREEVVALMAEYLGRARMPLPLDPTGSA